jgi:hypothetical protein
MWNPLRKKKKETEKEKRVEGGGFSLDESMPGVPDTKNMGFMERMAMKQFQKMSPEQQEKMLQKALDPKNIQKNKKKILEMLDGMEKSGQMDRQQVFQIKKQLGLL